MKMSENNKTYKKKKQTINKIEKINGQVKGTEETTTITTVASTKNMFI